MFGVNFEQYLWKPTIDKGARPGTKNLAFSTASFGFQEPGLGVFGRLAFLPGSRNAYDRSVSIGLAGRGLLPGRPLDRMGVGGYWLRASGDLRGLAGATLEDEWGGEVFYNYAITPAIQLTADVQYLDGGLGGGDNALVLGLRLFTQF
jgi:porin